MGRFRFKGAVINMRMIAKVNALILEFMKSNNFRKCGNLYFNIKNDISFCINLEQPTGLVYCTFSVMPLYMPAQVRYFTYGNRLNSFSPHPVPTLKKEASDFAVSNWSLQLRSALQETVFPFFDSISDASSLNEFLQDDLQNIRKYFFCAEIDIYRLNLYTNLALNRNNILLEMLSDSSGVLERSPHIQGEIKRKYVEEFSNMYHIVTTHGFDSCQFIKNTIQYTQKALFNF